MGDDSSVDSLDFPDPKEKEITLDIETPTDEGNSNIKLCGSNEKHNTNIAILFFIV